ncbi:hypothetical protein AB0H92_12405 [Streptomyces phaeochromogenes]|uniref:hypothetical protein n=1 Tax=Streptomyces phaeochromogenes TaxID=1923 RepID=UPI0033DD8F60
MAYSIEELRQLYPGEEMRQRILELSALGTLMGDSIVVPKYKISPSLHEPIAFTHAGNQLVRSLGSSRSVNWGELRVAVFIRLFHDELFVDPVETNFESIRKGLSSEIKARKVQYPYIFGRELYDKAFDEIGNESLRALDAPQTQKFLTGTPAGIFQLGETVVGPWGALKSLEYRSVPPTRSPRLYHCEKPGCLRAHRIELSTSDSRIKEVTHRLHKKLGSKAPSDWTRFLGEQHSVLSGSYDDHRSGGIIAFLGECFTQEELVAVACSAFSDRQLAFREVCFSQGISVRDANALLENKTKQEVMQLLLLLKDSDIVSSADKAVLAGAVKVPNGEVRVTRLNKSNAGAFDTRLECSWLGVRVATLNPAYPMRRLHRLVAEVYSETPVKKRLEWKIRNLAGETFDQKLRHYLSKEDTRKAIIELFLTGPDVFDSAARGVALTSTANEEDGALAERISWKLGFPAVTPDVGVGVLRSRVQDMREVTPSTFRSSDDEERLRGRSVHVFVELEKSLDSALCFSAWLTKFDHWSTHPRFTYSHVEARQFMAAALTEQAARSGKEISYDASGVNTLFPLIAGFGLLASNLEEVSAVRDEELRPVDDVPPMFRYSTLVKFGYPHKVPFLNFSEDSRATLLSELRSIARVLSEGKVLGIRNALEHHREEFPDCTDVLACLDAIEKYCDIVEGFGLIPITFRMVSYERDSSGRARYTYEDHAGRALSIPVYSPVILTGQPEFSKDQILVPGVRIADSDLRPRFSFGVTSPYTEMWTDWPRHRAVGLLKEALDTGADRDNADVSATESA